MQQRTLRFRARLSASSVATGPALAGDNSRIAHDSPTAAADTPGPAASVLPRSSRNSWPQRGAQARRSSNWCAAQTWRGLRRKMTAPSASVPGSACTDLDGLRTSAEHWSWSHRFRNSSPRRESEAWRSRNCSAAQTWRGYYREYAARSFRIFNPHIFLDADSVAPWIPFGKAEFDNICCEASRYLPQIKIVRGWLVHPLNAWIDRHKTKFERQCVLEAELGASPLLALAVIGRQTNSSVVKYVMDRAVYKHLIVQFLSIRV